MGEETRTGDKGLIREVDAETGGTGAGGKRDSVDNSNTGTGRGTGTTGTGAGAGTSTGANTEKEVNTGLAILTEEVGELARVIARKYGEQSFKEGEKENLADEMADVLWVLVCLANQTGVDLTEAIEHNFAKVLIDFDASPPFTEIIFATLASFFAFSG